MLHKYETIFPSGSEPLPEIEIADTGSVIVVSAPAFATGGSFGADCMASNSIQLRFQPPLAALVIILNVCCPAGRFTVSVMVVHDWKEPVLGTVSVFKIVP